MIKTFIDPLKISNKHMADWVNLKPKLESNVIITEEYYRNRESRVPNTHILVKLIKLLRSGSIDTSIGVYIDMIIEQSNFNLNNFGFTQSNRSGKSLYSEIYSDCIEHILIGDIPHNIFNMSNSWRDATPIKIVSTTSNDISLSHPYENENSEDNYYILDVTVLMLQYRYWAKERIDKYSSIDPAIFVYQYPLTNLMRSHYSGTLVNIFLGMEPIYTNVHPFKLLDVIRECINISNKISKKNINKKGDRFDTILYNIPLPFDDNILDFMYMSNYSSRTNIKWFYWLSHLEIFITLLEIPYVETSNKDIISSVIINLDMDMKTSIFREIDPINADRVIYLKKLLEEKS